MDVRSLSDLPKKVTEIIRIKCDNIESMRQVGKQLEVLGWRWATGCLPLCGDSMCFGAFENELDDVWVLGTNNTLTRESSTEYTLNLINASDLVKCSTPTLKVDLKLLNTDGRQSCYRCGESLKDPGCGPLYRHCPICEP